MIPNPIPRATSVQIEDAGMVPVYVPKKHVEWRAFFNLAMRFRQQAHQYRRWAVEYQFYHRQDLCDQWLVKSAHAWDCAWFYLAQAQSWQRYPRPSCITEN